MICANFPAEISNINTYSFITYRTTLPVFCLRLFAKIVHTCIYALYSKCSAHPLLHSINSMLMLILSVHIHILVYMYMLNVYIRSLHAIEWKSDSEIFVYFSPMKTNVCAYENDSPHHDEHTQLIYFYQQAKVKKRTLNFYHILLLYMYEMKYQTNEPVRSASSQCQIVVAKIYAATFFLVHVRMLLILMCPRHTQTHIHAFFADR